MCTVNHSTRTILKQILVGDIWYRRFFVGFKIKVRLLFLALSNSVSRGLFMNLSVYRRGFDGIFRVFTIVDTGIY